MDKKEQSNLTQKRPVHLHKVKGSIIEDTRQGEQAKSEKGFLDLLKSIWVS